MESAAEGGKWVETINGIVDSVRALGPFESYQKLNTIGPEVSGGAADASGETG